MKYLSSWKSSLCYHTLKNLPLWCALIVVLSVLQVLAFCEVKLTLMAIFIGVCRYVSLWILWNMCYSLQCWN